MDPSRAPAVRSRIWGVFSLVFFLQLLLGLAGVAQMLMSGSLHLPVPAVIIGGPLYRGEGLFMPILYGATLVLVGPAWCSYLCYIGAWDDRLSRLRKGRFRPLPAWAATGRWAALALTVGAAPGLRWAGVPGVQAAAVAAVFGLTGVAVMLLVSSRRGLMVHCTAFCPLGLVSNLLGKLSPWRMRIDPACTRCGACTRICRYGALAEADFERGRPGLTCTLCGDCLKACRQASIFYRFPGLSPETSRKAFLVLVVSLHAVFLGVARM
jgi:polyferredoxin